MFFFKNILSQLLLKKIKIKEVRKILALCTFMKKKTQKVSINFI